MGKRKFYLNLIEQPEGEHEIHVPGCWTFPEKDFEFLGEFQFATTALRIAVLRHPFWNINGCAHCCSEIDAD